jgi:rSAM/selenodomain-associated transferase 1
MNAEKGVAVGVAIMARAPVAGQAKTRLIPALGAAGAAALQRWLLRRTLTTALAAGVGPITLWCAGGMTHPEFASCRASGKVLLREQPKGDLGARMLEAVRAAAPSGSLIIGTDCPVLTPRHLQQAAASLRRQDAVVIPADDGGYVLIGMRQAAIEAFSDIEWGGANVMAQTRCRFEALKWRWSEQDSLWDVDRPDDVERLLLSFPEVRTML